MKWKIVIAVLYVAGAVAAGTVYCTYGAGANPDSSKSISSEEVNEYEAKVSGLQSRLDNVCAKLVKAEAEKSDLKSEIETLQSEVDRLTDEAKERKTEDEATASEDESVEAKDASSNGTDAEAEDADKVNADKEEAGTEETNTDEINTEETNTEETNTGDSSIEGTNTGVTDSEAETAVYYTYKVNTNRDPLRVYNKPVEGKQKESLPRKYTGYVISLGDEEDARALILYKGRLYYASKSLLLLTEIDADDYPEELQGLSSDDVGKKFFGGKAIGIEKDN